VLAYITTPDEDWDEETCPPRVRAAVLVATKVLFDEPGADPLNATVQALLIGLRDPPLA
jgi:hypothetical protein